MSWYEGWFDSKAYDLVYAHRDEDEAEQLVDLIEDEVAPAPTAHIVDVGCGRGRHALIFAERGYTVTGVDLSPEAISEARLQAQEDGVDVTFEQGDMRTPYCDGCADGVVNLFTTFGYFETDAENLRALQAMSMALRPNGWFVQDFLNAPQVKDTLVPSTTRTVRGVTIQQERWIDDGRIKKRITLDHDDGIDTFFESVRLYTREDLVDMYPAADLELVDTYGSYDGAPHTPDSPRLILFARKASG